MDHEVIKRVSRGMLKGVADAGVDVGDGHGDGAGGRGADGRAEDHAGEVAVGGDDLGGVDAHIVGGGAGDVGVVERDELVGGEHLAVVGHALEADVGGGAEDGGQLDQEVEAGAGELLLLGAGVAGFGVLTLDLVAEELGVDFVAGFAEPGG